MAQAPRAHVLLVACLVLEATALSPAWTSQFRQALVDQGVTETPRSEAIAGVLTAAAPHAVGRLSPVTAAQRIKEHLSCDEARRTRHDAVVRLIAAQCRRRESARVFVDKPLAVVDSVGPVRRKSRRVDIVVELGESTVFIEVTVLARVSAKAVADKAKKYRDLPTPPIVVAVGALDGEIPRATLQALAAVGIDADSLADAVRAALSSLAASPLRDFVAQDPRRPIHVKRRKRRPPRSA